MISFVNDGPQFRLGKFQWKVFCVHSLLADGIGVEHTSQSNHHFVKYT